MTHPSLSIAEVLDDSADAVARIASPWLGLLWLTALPLRLLQAHFVARLIDLGAEAGHYGAHLREIALAAACAFLLSTWGRAVFVRACGLGLRSVRAPGAESLRIPAAGAACYLYAALLVEVLFFALGWTVVAAPLLIVLAGLAAATFPLNERPGLVAPLREIARHTRPARVLVGLRFVFDMAFLIAFVNMHFVFALGLWLAGAVPGLDLTRWQALLSLGNPRYLLVLWAGATLAVEPFWLGALTVFVHKVRARQSGEDLRLLFERLRRAAA